MVWLRPLETLQQKFLGTLKSGIQCCTQTEFKLYFVYPDPNHYRTKGWGETPWANYLPFTLSILDFMGSLPPAYVVRQEVIFSRVCFCSGGGGGGTLVPGSLPGPFRGDTRVLGSFPGFWFQVLSGGYPSSSWGYPSPGWGLFQKRDTPIQVRMGYPPPPTRTEVPLPPPLDRTAEQALATRRAVCLLRSRRRTFLFRVKCWNLWN